MTEKQLQAAIIEAARLQGWLVAHFRSVPVKRGSSVRWETPVQADGKGFPDLILVRDRLIAIELKVEGRLPTTEQWTWIKALHGAGISTYLVTEHVWMSGQLDPVLQRPVAA